MNTSNKAAWYREFELGSYTICLKVHENKLSVDFEVTEDGGRLVYDGSAKWDGCINWTTGTECAAHFCGPESIDEMKLIFIAIWNAAREMMPSAFYGAIPPPRMTHATQRQLRAHSDDG